MSGTRPRHQTIRFRLAPLLLAVLPLGAAPRPIPEGFTPLFDGESLAGALRLHYSNEQTPRWREGGYHRYRNVAVRELAP